MNRIGLGAVPRCPRHMQRRWLMFSLFESNIFRWQGIPWRCHQRTVMVGIILLIKLRWEQIDNWVIREPPFANDIFYMRCYANCEWTISIFASWREEHHREKWNQELPVHPHLQGPAGSQNAIKLWKIVKASPTHKSQDFGARRCQAKMHLRMLGNHIIDSKRRDFLYHFPCITIAKPCQTTQLNHWMPTLTRTTLAALLSPVSAPMNMDNVLSNSMWGALLTALLCCRPTC